MNDQPRLGRPSYLMKAADNLTEAIAKLGEVRAKGAQLEELDAVYELLLISRDQLDLAAVQKITAA